MLSRRTNGHRPLALAAAKAEPAQDGPAHLEVVPLSEIVGTLEPTTLFDARLRPASGSVGPRRRRVAPAHRTDVPLPPIDVVCRAEGYHVTACLWLARTATHTPRPGSAAIPRPPNLRANPRGKPAR